MLESFGADGPTAVLVKNPEGHPDHVLVVVCIHLVRHHIAELTKLNHTRTISVILENFSF